MFEISNPRYLHLYTNKPGPYIVYFTKKDDIQNLIHCKFNRIISKNLLWSSIY